MTFTENTVEVLISPAVFPFDHHMVAKFSHSVSCALCAQLLYFLVTAENVSQSCWTEEVLPETANNRLRQLVLSA